MRRAVVSTDDAGHDLLALLRCPTCRSALAPAAAGSDDVGRVECTSCGARWPVRWGIPDLRPPGVDDPYITIDEDLRAAERLVRRAEAGGGFADVLASYYETNAKVPPAQAARFTAGTLAAGGRAEAILRAWRELDGAAAGTGLTMIDAGCGTGPLTVAALRAGFRTIALDVGLRSLVLARARAREAGVPFAAACAGVQCLPFADATVDVVASEYLLENVVPHDPALAESARVLRPAGRFWGATANRWSLGPDPHLGVPFSGWWPAAAVRRYARARGAVPPNRALLSAHRLRRDLAAHGFRDIRLVPAPIAESQRATAGPALRLAVDWYGRVARTAPGGSLLTLIGPSFVVTAVRPGPHEAAA